MYYYKDFKELIDMIQENSLRPILIEGTPGDGKITYLQNNYHTILYDANSFNDNSFKTNDEKAWYDDVCTQSRLNPNEKILVIFDSIDELRNYALPNFFDNIVFNKNDKYPLPEGVKIVCVTNIGSESDLLKNYLEAYKDSFAVVGAPYATRRRQ